MFILLASILYIYVLLFPVYSLCKFWDKTLGLYNSHSSPMPTRRVSLHVLQVRDHTRLPCAPSPQPYTSMSSKSVIINNYHALQVRNHTRLSCAPSPQPYTSMSSKSVIINNYHALQVRSHTCLPCAPSPQPYTSAMCSKSTTTHIYYVRQVR